MTRVADMVCAKTHHNKSCVSGWTFAHTIAQDRPHKLNEKFNLRRFNTGHLIDEKGVGTKTWIG